jgi:hypothetical protein
MRLTVIDKGQLGHAGILEAAEGRRRHSPAMFRPVK